MDDAFPVLDEAKGGQGVEICIHNVGYLVNIRLIANAEALD
jgi:hypothetical protein